MRRIDRPLFMHVKQGSGLVDPYYAFRVLGLHFQGPNASTTFIDNSKIGATPTVFGNAQLSTTNPKFGVSCGLFDGTGDYLQFALNSLYDQGSGDLCVHGWINPATVSALGVILATRPTGADRGFQLQVNASAKLQVVCWDASGNGIVNLASVTSLVVGVYQHIAFTKSGSVYSLWLNGALEATSSTATAMGPTGGSNYVGRDPTVTGREFNGRIGELLHYVGVPIYTTPFAPPQFAAVP